MMKAEDKRKILRQRKSELAEEAFYTLKGQRWEGQRLELSNRSLCGHVSYECHIDN